MSQDKRNNGHDEVPIFIDKNKFKLASPQSGSNLYTIGGVGPGYDLFRETRGQGDDEFIPNDPTLITLHPGDHFYTAQSSLNPGG
jgi:hypothetical protein